MAERDYVSTPVADDLGLRGVIQGLANDLQDLRAGKISPHEALARAALAKQLWNGCRVYLQAVKTMEGAARSVPGDERDAAAIESK